MWDPYVLFSLQSSDDFGEKTLILFILPHIPFEMSPSQIREDGARRR